VTKLVAKDGAVEGVVAGSVREEAIRAEKVILATDGFAGNREMVRAYCEADIADALYYGSDGNTGDGIRWGAELGGALASMDAFKGHATVVSGTGALSTYAVVMNGGILVNADGERFGNESKGYSEFAVDVVRQPDGVAYEIFDERIFERLQGEFDDFDRAVELGSYTSADTVEELAAELGCAPRGDPGRGRVVQRGRRRGRTRRRSGGPTAATSSPRRSTGPRSPARCSTRRAGWSSTNTRGCSGRTGRPSTGSTPGWHRDGHQRSRGRRLPLRERAHDRHGARPARRSARRPVAG